MVEERVQRRLAAILAADVVGYSRLMGHDETGTLAALKAHRDELIEPKSAEYHGRIVKLTGDGTLMEFGSAVDAVLFADDLQRAMVGRNEEVPEDCRITYRVGINIGDIIIDGDDIYGDGVNVAARLEGLADPGGICVARNVFNQVKSKVDLGFEDMGEQEFKNITEPVRAYRVLKGSEAPGAASPASEVAALQLPDKPSIAVLPFANMSGDPEQEYFADGIVDDIITTLSKVPLLFVVSRNSTFVYKGKAVDIKQVAADQGVRYVLEGSVRRAGDRVRINAQLIDATDGQHVWADRYDGGLDDVFGLQDTITQEIVSALEVRLTEGDQARVWRSRAGDPLVYDHMLRGRSYYEQFTKRTHAQARQEFEAAVRLNPDYATSYIYLAYTHADAARWGWSEDPAQSLQPAFESVGCALGVDPEEPDAIACRSYTHLVNREHETALTDIRQAIELGPSRAEIHHVAAMVYDYSGLPEEGKGVARQAVRLSPMAYSHILTELAHAHCLLRQHDEAIAVLKNVLADRPFWRSARSLLVYAFWESGATDEAKSEAAELLRGAARFSLAQWAKCHPYRNPDDLERYMSALSNAGLPE